MSHCVDGWRMCLNLLVTFLTTTHIHSEHTDTPTHKHLHAHIHTMHARTQYTCLTHVFNCFYDMHVYMLCLELVCIMSVCMWCVNCTGAHTHTQRERQTHTHIHTYTYTQYTNTQTHAQMTHTHIHTRTHKHTQTHIHTHTRVQAAQSPNGRDEVMCTPSTPSPPDRGNLTSAPTINQTNLT